ncbi:hypothetical protein QFZ23_002113 [Arthrobacter globiformis]|nr:hypothetical protein [Arthrobacter globiformis]
MSFIQINLALNAVDREGNCLDCRRTVEIILEQHHCLFAISKDYCCPHRLLLPSARYTWHFSKPQCVQPRHATCPDLQAGQVLRSVMKR